MVIAGCQWQTGRAADRPLRSGSGLQLGCNWAAAERQRLITDATAIFSNFICRMRSSFLPERGKISDPDICNQFFSLMRMSI